MSLVAWNCRGVGWPSAIPDLKYLVHNKIEELRF